MIYGIIEDGRISAIMCGPSVPEGAVPLPDNFDGIVGQARAEFTDEWILKPLSVRVSAGLVPLPEGFRLEGEELVPKNLSELVADGLVPMDERHVLVEDGPMAWIREKTFAELVRDGLEARPRGSKLAPSTNQNGGPELVPMTIDEQVAAGDLSKEVGFSLKLADWEIARKMAYADEADPLYLLAIRGEVDTATGKPITMADWEAKIAEIKDRLPKPEAFR